MVNSQASTVFDSQDLYRSLAPPARAKRGRPKQSQSQSQSMPPPLPSTRDVEYQKWDKEGRRPNELRPLEFRSTQRQKQAYPRLPCMDKDLFTIPAMSDEPERVLSSAGLMTRPHRGRLSARAIGEAQCVKTWLKTDIITSLEGTFENVAMYPIDMEIED
jgi:hypothetical protein